MKNLPETCSRNSSLWVDFYSDEIIRVRVASRVLYVWVKYCQWGTRQGQTSWVVAVKLELPPPAFPRIRRTRGKREFLGIETLSLPRDFPRISHKINSRQHHSTEIFKANGLLSRMDYISINYWFNRYIEIFFYIYFCIFLDT